MSKSNTLFILGLALGTGLGFLASGSLTGYNTGADPAPATDAQTGHGAGHDHDKLLDMSGDATPGLTLDLRPEGNCTYNLQIVTTGFRFAPEAVNSPHVAGEGHAHLYADGVKLARLYGPWFHFTAPAGTQDIRVTLNANSHETLAIGDAPIDATAPLPDCQG